MGGWDELCVFTGIRPGGGPTVLTFDVESTAEKMAEEMMIMSPHGQNFTVEQLMIILKDVLDLCSRSDGFGRGHWWPDGFGHGGFYDTAIAIGYFGQFGFCNAMYWDQDLRRAAGGREVELRRVRAPDGYGGFSTILPLGSLDVGETQEEEEAEKENTVCTSYDGSTNFFALEGPYRYLEAWINREMDFAGELYEIVNSRSNGRVEYNWDVHRAAGYLPCIDYDGIEKCPSDYQDEFFMTRKGSRWTSDAISRGLCGKELVPYLIRDFNAWICMRPDLWPSPPTVLTPLFTIFDESCALTHMYNLPNDLLLEIFSHVYLTDLMSLSSTCRSMRNLLTNAGTLNAVLRQAVLSRHGSLRWILPVLTVQGEVKFAEKIAHEWLTSPYATAHAHISKISAMDSPLFESESAFRDQTFPYYVFIPIYLTVGTGNESFSMSSRKRLWRQAQQFQELWLEYRTKGWETDIFSMFDEETLKVRQAERNAMS
ncbi:hypothetical protein D9758_018434 [Tetrapyrgos nigripes]|uniref:F-box domain-containing protein n=1 Tax=Tetrapyrgos nigripes TaxID=182062 RepID=A0A8H5C3L4_9AGAR|nr:hypothetical protein D9758_018434 [Tetrapyrgos nigripes]